VKPTGRPAKSTTSIIDKRQRESIRLRQMQDVAGCRIIVGDVLDQDRLLQRVQKTFPGCAIADRRRRPSHGYRAVHVIVKVESRPIEIQVRTRLQHMWAEVSERLSDSVGVALKYGRGPKNHQGLLAGASNLVAQIEAQELRYAAAAATLSRGSAGMRQLDAALRYARKQAIEFLEEVSRLSDSIERAE
jgi:ppGpp synthetase/RelA/SpoT-type nucleotidyltranferase